jgi:probable HAF family extracellular repeat protein
MHAFNLTALALVATLHAPVNVAAVSSSAFARPSVSYDQVELGTLGGATSWGLRIDNYGRVFGISRTAGGANHVFLWADGALTDLDLEPEGFYFDANERGEVSVRGSYQGGPTTGYVWSRGSIVELGMDYPFAMNDRGDVAGLSSARLPELWRHGSIVDLSQPGNYATPRALNNLGEVVGEVGIGAFQGDAIRWRRDGSTETALLPGTSACSASDINERGEAVGLCFAPDGSRHAFLWDKEGISELAFGATEAEALSINDRGQIAGYIVVSGGDTRAVFWENGVSTRIEPPPGATETFPVDINERGQVVGYMWVSGSGQHVFVWDSGVLNDLGLGTASDINDRGEVTGFNASSIAVIWRPAKP